MFTHEFKFLEQESNTSSNGSTKDTSAQDVGVSSTSRNTGRSVVGTVRTVRTVRGVSGLDSSNSSKSSDDVLELHFYDILVCVS